MKQTGNKITTSFFHLKEATVIFIVAYSVSELAVHSMHSMTDHIVQKSHVFCFKLEIEMAESSLFKYTTASHYSV